MRLVMEEFKKALQHKEKYKLELKKKAEDEKDEDLPFYQIGRMTKRDLFERLRAFLAKCLRKVRAYNFDDVLVEQLKVHYEYLYDCDHLRDKQILDLRYFFNQCYVHMSVKAKSDPNLSKLESFQATFAKFERAYKEVEEKASEIEIR